MKDRDDIHPLKKIDRGQRLGAMMLDQVLMTIPFVVLAVPFMFGSSLSTTITHEPEVDFFGNLGYSQLLGFAIYVSKDSINGRSPAKRILKFQVVNNANGAAASPWRCVVRNIFDVLWPIEVIVALINPERRIGDFVAGTKVIAFDPTRKQERANWLHIGISLVPAFIAAYLFTSAFGLMPGANRSNINYVKTSFNEQESKATAQLLADSLGSYATVDVKVYDRLEEENLKYVSVILRLKENYFSEPGVYRPLESKATALLLSKFPEKTFVGRVRFVYQHRNDTKWKTVELDWREDNDKARQ